MTDMKTTFLGLLLLTATAISAQEQARTFQLADAPRYSEETGYGYDLAPTPEKGSKAPFFFSVRVPDGNYKVTVRLGSKKQAGVTTVRGDMGLVAKKVSMECGIKNLSVILFEMDASKLKPLKSRTNKFEHLAEYPETDYDISMLFDSDAVWNDIYDAVMGKKKASALLKDASFVDEYRGKQIPQGKKSVTIRLTIGSDEKTLTSQEIESVAEQVMKKLGKKMGAELRTQ